MSRREQILLSIAIVLFAGMVFYLFVYTPQARAYDDLALERDSRVGQVTQMRSVIARKEAVRAEFGRVSARIAAFEAKLPSEKGIPAFLVALEQLTLEVTTDLRAVKPGAMEAIRDKSPQPAAATPAAGEAAAAPGPQGEKAEAPVRYYVLPIDVEMNGGFPRLVTLLSRLDAFPRFINVRKLQVATLPTELGLLRSTLFIEAYVLPQKGAK